jgi:heat shock protein HslJ
MRAELSRLTLIALCSASALTAAACASLAPEPSYAGASASELTGTSWVAASIDGAPVAGRAPSLALNAEDRLSGSGGCNRLTAVYVAEAGAIAVRALGATEMACEDALMAQESAFLALLGDADRYEHEADRLVIADDDGRNIVFIPA